VAETYGQKSKGARHDVSCAGSRQRVPGNAALTTDQHGRARDLAETLAAGTPNSIGVRSAPDGSDPGGIEFGEGLELQASGLADAPVTRQQGRSRVLKIENQGFFRDRPRVRSPGPARCRQPCRVVYPFKE